MSMVNKLSRVVTYCEELPPINSHDHSSCGLVRSREKLNYISTPSRRPTGTKLDIMVAYCERLPTFKVT